MINFLKSWCEGIIVAVLISLIIETLLPEGNSKKYAKVIVGIFIIYTILTPFLGKLNTEIDFENMNLASIETFSNADSAESIQKMYLNSIQEALKQEIQEKFDYTVENLDITYDENYETIKKISLTLNTNNVATIKKVEIGNTTEEQEESNPLYDDVRSYICENYDIDKNNVIVK